MVFVRARRGPGRQRGIYSPFPSTRSRVRRGLTLVAAIHPRTLQITFTILLRFTLGSFAPIQRLASDTRKRIVIVRCVTVVFVCHFTFTITFVLLDGDAWPQRLAIGNREATRASAGLPLANVLADSYLDALVSKRARERGGL
jgi:hypothetical protein